MTAEYIVVAPKQAAGSHGDGLLADPQMKQALDLAHGIEGGNFFFERADQPHCAEKRNEVSWVLSLGCHGY
jgi:hypothetical protein